MSRLIPLLIVRILLDYSYIIFVTPIYGATYGAFGIEFVASQYLASWLLYIAMLGVIKTTLRRVSDLIFVVVITTVGAPLTSLYGLSGESVIPPLTLALSLFVAYIIVYMRIPVHYKSRTIRYGPAYAVALALSVVAVVVLHYLASGVEFNLNFRNVYIYRTLNNARANNGIFAYLNVWAFAVCNLFLLAYCLLRKNYVGAFLSVVAQGYLFIGSQQKSVILSPLIVIGSWWLFTRTRNLLIIPYVVILLIGTGLSLYLLLDYSFFAAIFIDRLFFTPAKLTYVYFSFFSEQPFILWRGSTWLPLTESPYSTDMAHVIGAYLGRPEMGANNGLISSGFAQAGYIGILIYTLIMGFTMRVVDSITKGSAEPWFAVAIFTMSLLTIWQSGDLPTIFLTNGLLLLLFLTFLARSKNNNYHETESIYNRTHRQIKMGIV